ncbi:hypothetical protein HK104_003731, partial [Borealophlyctis nickersoniae]
MYWLYNKVATEAAATTIATNIVNSNKFTGGTIQNLTITGQGSNHITPTLEGYSALTGNGFQFKVVNRARVTRATFLRSRHMESLVNSSWLYRTNAPKKTLDPLRMQPTLSTAYPRF